MNQISPLQKARAAYAPKLPPALAHGAMVRVIEGAPTTAVADVEKIREIFKTTFGSPALTFEADPNAKGGKAINVGVILSGGQAPGGHNVIAGLFDGLKSIHPDCRLYGFLKGPDGLVRDEYMELTSDVIDAYRNTGGFDMIGSGRTKLETDEQFEAARRNCEVLGISALVIIGGDDSNTNACMLAEYFKSNNIPIQVIGCPKTIDGDLKNEWIEASFGFDTACRVYSELIGNIGRDANSAKKYWHFIKLMGRSASHIALECALQTQPNIAIISEEVAAKKMTLAKIVEEIAVVVAARAAAGMNFGVALIPEGLIEFVPEIKVLIAELNDLLAANAAKVDAMEKSDKVAFAAENLSAESAAVFRSLPAGIQMQLCNDRDPHGNVQVSLIETEKMLADFRADRRRTVRIHVQRPKHHETLFTVDRRRHSDHHDDEHRTPPRSRQAGHPEGAGEARRRPLRILRSAPRRMGEGDRLRLSRPDSVLRTVGGVRPCDQDADARTRRQVRLQWKRAISTFATWRSSPDWKFRTGRPPRFRRTWRTSWRTSRNSANST